MASFLRSLRPNSTRLLRTSYSLSARGYVAAAVPPKARTIAARVAPKTPAAQASTAAANGNGNDNGNPELRDDVDVVETMAVPPESIPSSSSHSAPPPFSSESGIGSIASETTLEPGVTDWSKSYRGLSSQPFPKDAADILLTPVQPMDIEIKPDGMIYLPEIKYRRILNRAFGPGGWGLAPRSETNVGSKIVSREYALVCLGRLVSIARGEQEYFDVSGIPTATEACKSNALMRCCKDLGVASELWDPRFIREFKAQNCIEVFTEHVPTKRKKKLWRRKDQPKFEYPYKE